MRFFILIFSLIVSFFLFAEKLKPEKRIYGGSKVSENNPVAKSTVGFFSESDYKTAHAIIDGSGTLVAPNVIVGAAHTCLNFSPSFVYFGTTPPDEEFGYSYSQYVGTNKYPNTRKIKSCVAHPQYNPKAQGPGEDSTNPDVPAYDIAIFYIDSTPTGFIPAKVLSPSQTNLPQAITIAGFGAYEDQFDNIHTTGMLPYELRKVDSFISEVYSNVFEFKDGPNPGKGSCQGDSGGPVYFRTNDADTPILIGTVVRGPECDKGIGYNTDVRYFVNWIEQTAKVTLKKEVISTDCGNGQIDEGEFCDGNSISCIELNEGFISGEAVCNNFCSGWDKSSCKKLISDDDVVNDEDFLDNDETSDYDEIIDNDIFSNDNNISDESENDSDEIYSDKETDDYFSDQTADSDEIAQDDFLNDDSGIIGQDKDDSIILSDENSDSSDNNLSFDSDKVESSDNSENSCGCSLIF